jgi:hypothetical protein
MRSSALSTHVGTALGNEFQLGVRIESRLRRQLYLREPIHTRIHSVVRDDQHQKGKCAHKREKCPRGPFNSLSSSLLLKSLRRCGVQDVRVEVFALNEPVLSALGGDLFKFFAVNRGALEPIITPHTVPNEMNSVVIGFCPSRSRNRVSTLTARIVFWKLY